MLYCITPNPRFYYEGDFPVDLDLVSVFLLVDSWFKPAAAAAAADTAWWRLDGIMNEWFEYIY